MERSAIRESGNVLTSGFVDGWADVLATTIDISTPEFTFGPASGLVDRLVGDRSGRVALVFDSQVHARTEDLGVTVYAFPRLEELVGLMQDIEF